MQRILSIRWRAAVARRRADGGASLRQLRKRWEAAGLAVVTADETDMRLVLFMRAETRARWRRPAAHARDFRSQQYAPPDPLPPDTLEIYAEGSADARKKNTPPPPAGYGYAVYLRGREMYRAAGQIWAGGTPNVQTTTHNLADLVAFARGLQWARSYALSQGRPVCVRYSSEYAARIATGAWKAKKHKAMAAEARRAWAALKRTNSGRVWMRHASGKHPRMAVAQRLADGGKQGTSIRAATVD